MELTKPRDSWDMSGKLRVFNVDYDLRELEDFELKAIESQLIEEVSKMRLMIESRAAEKALTGIEDYEQKSWRNRVNRGLHIRNMQLNVVNVEWMRRRNLIPPLSKFYPQAVLDAIESGIISPDVAEALRTRADELQHDHMLGVLAHGRSLGKSAISKEKACGGKVPHETKAEALAHIESLRKVSDDIMSVYQCPWCTKWHVGHRLKASPRRGNGYRYN